MAKIISFFSNSPNQGKRTISQSFAKILSNNNQKVLYVELDYYNPSFANSTQISHPKKNIRGFIQSAVLQSKFDVEPYIYTSDEVKAESNKRVQTVHAELPKNLHFLTLPLNFEETTFPTITNSEDEKSEEEAFNFVEKIMFQLRNLEYSVIIINLPNEIKSVFGLPVLIESDQVVNVITANPTRIVEYQNVLKTIKHTSIDLKEWFTVINQTNSSIDDSEYMGLINEENAPMLIPYDIERANYEFSLKIGSPSIDLCNEELIQSMGFPIQPKAKRKGLFASRR